MQPLEKQYLLGLGKMNAEFKELAQRAPTGASPHSASDLYEFRAKLAAMEASNPQPSIENYQVEDRHIPMRDGIEITIRIHKPKHPPLGGGPIFVIYHGGGFALGDLDSEIYLCKQWVRLGGVAVNVDYRLAPEHLFPGPVYDAFDALKWTASHIDELNVNPAKGFLVGGISAGGNFAAVVPHLYRDEGLTPPLTGVYISVPSICPPEVLPEKYKEFYLSQEQNKDAPVLNKATMKLFEELYKPDNASPLRSPLLFDSHKDLPPAYLQVCGLDPMRDEALIYEKVLREEYGIKTRMDVYSGLPHAFWSIFPEASFSKKMRQDSVNGLKWLLEQAN